MKEITTNRTTKTGLMAHSLEVQSRAGCTHDHASQETQTGRVRAQEDGSPSESAVKAVTGLRRTGPAWPRGCGSLAFSVTPEALLLALCPGAQILSQIQEGTQWHIIFLMMLGNRQHLGSEFS